MWVGVCLLLAACAAAPSAYAQTYGTTVTLDPLPSWVYAGDMVAFSGTLTSGGYALPGRTVLICEDDPFIPDECLASATTGSDGRFGVWWTAEAGTLEIDFDIYAEFRGDGAYGRDQTPRYTMGVYKHGGSITLDPIPERAAYGEAVSLSGTLSLDAHSPEGAVIYIKDEDALGFDDLLTTAYVDASGRFTTSWIVADVDPDYNIDIQAVYEGNRLYYRLASPIQKLYGYDGITEPGPAPVPGDIHMKLYRSLDFDRTPRVAIVPSPDSYDEVRGHIVPVQEGILGLAAMLERSYPAGDWDVDFEVVAPGDRFSARPDVIVNLVTRDDTRGDRWDCNADRFSGGLYGWAFHTAPKPVPTTVCSYDFVTDVEIGATAAHEFVHAIGLGHTFNSPADLMCSIEDSVRTCPDETYRPTTFSDLNLAAIVAIYGTDGFQNPNNRITYGDRLPLADHQSGNYPTSPPDQSAPPAGYSGGYDGLAYTDYLWYYPGETVLIDGFYWGTYDGPSSIMVLDPDGYIADHVHVDVADDLFGAQTDGYYMPGAYTVWVFDGQSNFVANTAFHVADPQTASAYGGYAYAEFLEYGRGEDVTVRGYYWDPYHAASSIDILGPDGHQANLLHLGVTGSDFSTAAGRYYEPGVYTVLLYDHLDSLVSSSTFRVVDPADAGLYSASVYTDYTQYYPGETVLIDGFYWGSYDGPSSIEVEDPYGYVVDELSVDVVGDFFVAETAGHYLPGTYTVWLYDDLDELVSGTAFHITGDNEP